MSAVLIAFKTFTISWLDGYYDPRPSETHPRGWFGPDNGFDEFDDETLDALIVGEETILDSGVHVKRES